MYSCEEDTFETSSLHDSDSISATSGELGEPVKAVAKDDDDIEHDDCECCKKPGLVLFAENELRRLSKATKGETVGREMQEMINGDILSIVKMFSSQGHSGFSAAYAIRVLTRLLDFKPLSPVEGHADEWGKPFATHGNRFQVSQNRRCSALFRNVDTKTGKASYEYLDKYVFSDNGGITWFSSAPAEEMLGLSREVTLPFSVPDHPIRIYIEYNNEVPIGESSDDFTVITDDPDRIRRLRERSEKRFCTERCEGE